MNNSIRIYIIILNYNNWADTIECLESILRNDYPNYQIIVVDNDSPNNSMEYIKAWAEGKLEVWVNPKNPLRILSFPPKEKPIPYIFYTREEAEKGGSLEKEEKLKTKFHKEVLTTDYPMIFIQTGKNLGFAGGNNVALRYLLKKEVNLEKSIVWLLNPDMVVSRNSIKNTVNCAQNYKTIYGTVVKSYYNPKKIQYIGGAKIYKYIGIIKFINSFNNLKSLDYISGGSLIVTLSAFKKVGLLPEKYFLYWEDADWCTKAKYNGFDLGVCIDTICYNKVSTSIGKGYLAEYYYSLNSLKFFAEYHPGSKKYIFFFNLIRIAKRVVNLKFYKALGIIKATIKELVGE